MPPLPSVEGFDYTSAPDKRSWTRAYVKKALGSEASMKELFRQANELVDEHQVHSKAFASHQHPKKALDKKRTEVAAALESELGDSIAIENHPSFAAILCKGVLVYQSESGRPIKVTHKSQAETKVKHEKTHLD